MAHGNTQLVVPHLHYLLWPNTQWGVQFLVQFICQLCRHLLLVDPQSNVPGGCCTVWNLLVVPHIHQSHVDRHEGMMRLRCQINRTSIPRARISLSDATTSSCPPSGTPCWPSRMHHLSPLDHAYSPHIMHYIILTHTY